MPIYPRKKLIMLPGPVDVPEKVLSALSKPVISHRGEEFHELYSHIEEMAKKVFQTNSRVFVFTASGTGGVEAAVLNIVRPGDKVVVPIFGEFGRRLAKQIERAGGKVVSVDASMGTAPDLEQIKEAFETNDDIKAFFTVYNDTSPGTTYRLLKDAISIAKRNGVFTVVDAISILGGDELPQDKWGIDVVIAGSQKCIAMPPGLALVSVSDKVMEYVKENPPITTYFDFAKQEEFLEKKKETPFTPATPLFYALEVALEEVLDEGLEERIRKHRIAAKAFYKALSFAGLEPFVEERFRSNVVIAAKYRKGMDDKTFRGMLNKKFDVVIAGGFGDLKGKIFRIGNMGSIQPSKVIRTVSAIGNVMNLLGFKVDMAEMLKVVEEELKEL